MAAHLVAVEQPFPGLHRVFGRVGPGTADPRRRPPAHELVRRRCRKADRHQPVHHGRRPHRHHRPGRHHRGQRLLLPEPRGVGPAQGRTGRQARLQQQPRIRIRPLEPRPRALDRPVARRELGGGLCSTARTARPPGPCRSISPLSSASPVRPRSATVGPPGPGLDDQLPGEPGPPRLGPRLSVVPHGPARFQAEVGAWAGSARFENTFAGHRGMGYVTGLDTEGEQCGRGHVRAQRRPSPTPIPRGQLHRHSVEQ